MPQTTSTGGGAEEPFFYIETVETKQESVNDSILSEIDMPRGYYVNILWEQCQLDFIISKVATCLDVLEKAKNMIAEKHGLSLATEDAWDGLYNNGTRMDTKT